MKRLQGIFISLIILGSINGCATDSQHEESTEFPFDLMVNITDLSNQFKYWSGEYPIVDGAISLKVSYRNKSEKTGTFFTHQISIYTDTESAQLAFPSWENDWFNEHWIHPSNSVYSLRV